MLIGFGVYSVVEFTTVEPFINDLKFVLASQVVDEGLRSRRTRKDFPSEKLKTC